MWQTLIFIPHAIGGIPVFGFGLALALWLLGGAIWIGIQARRHGWSPETREPLPLLIIGALAIVFLFPILEIKAANGEPLGVPIRGYGTLMLIGVLAGWGLSVRRALHRGLTVETIAALGFSVFIAGIIGARAFFVIEYWEEFRQPTWGATLATVLKFTEGGLVVYGSLIGGFAAYVWFARSRGLPMMALGDVIAPGVILGMAIGRLGCLMNGCCYGGLCDEDAWGIQFPRFSSTVQRTLSPPYADQLGRGQLHGFYLDANSQGQPQVQSVEPNTEAARSGLTAGVRVAAINGTETPDLASAHQVLVRTGAVIAVQTADQQVYRWQIAELPSRSLPVHPAQIYSAVSSLLICLVLLAAEPYINRDGALFALFLTLYPIVRILEEVIRVDEPGQLGTALSIAQWVSLGVLAGAVVSWIVVLARRPGLTRFRVPQPAVD